MATACLLRVPMHCRCDGCTEKIRAGVKDLTLHYGIQALDQSALSTKGELKVLLAAGAGDPDRLRRRLRKSTGKKVDLVLLPITSITGGPNKQQQQAAADEKLLLQALLRGELQPAAQYGHGGLQQGAWAGHQVLPPGYAYGAGAGAAAAPQQASYSYSYPWGVQQPDQAYPHGLGAYGGGGWSGY